MGRVPVILILCASLFFTYVVVMGHMYMYKDVDFHQTASIEDLMMKFEECINASKDRINVSVECINASIEEVRLKHQGLATQQSGANESDKPQPTVYVITPTYKRAEQIPDMTRLGQTLMTVRNLHWIVAEDAKEENTAVIDLIKSTGMPYTYLLTPMPESHKKINPKGVANRNGGINWLRKNVKEGVFYLADDDNTYDRRIFEEMRYTKNVSFFPVGLVTSYGLSTPVVKDGKFAGWYDGWIGGRKYPVDMGTFAVSVPYLLSKPKAYMAFTVDRQETQFLESLEVNTDEIEFLADNCTKIYVWHTRTQHSPNSDREILNSKYDNTNLRELQKQIFLKDK